MRRLLSRCIALPLLLLLVAACGDDESSPAGPGEPAAPSAATLTQQGAAALGVETGLAAAAAHAVLAGSGTAAGKTAVSGLLFGQLGTIDLTLDLDSPGPDGQDLFPGLSGQVRFAGTPVVSGDSQAGSLALQPLQATAITDIAYVDSAAGTTATITRGAVVALGLDIDWTYEAADEYRYTVAVAESDEDIAVRVVQGGERSALTMSGGAALTYECTVTSGVTGTAVEVAVDKTVAGDIGGAPHRVRLQAEGSGRDGYVAMRYTVTVDGTPYGPFSASELPANLGAAPPVPTTTPLADMAGYPTFDRVQRGAVAAQLLSVVMANAMAAPGSGLADLGSLAAGQARTVDFTIDLDTPGPGGDDLFPDATGQLRVRGTGDVGGNASAPEIAMDPLSVTCLTAVVATDPANGATATLAPGDEVECSARLQLDLAVSVSGVRLNDAALVVTLATQGLSLQVTDASGAGADLTLTTDTRVALQVGGDGAVERQVSSTSTVRWTDGQRTDQVTLIVQYEPPVEAVTVQVNGTTFGPLTPEEFLDLMQVGAVPWAASPMEELAVAVLQ